MTGPGFDWDGARAEFVEEARRRGGAVRLAPGMPRDWDASAREFRAMLDREGRGPRVGDRMPASACAPAGPRGDVSPELEAFAGRWLVVAARPQCEFRAALEADDLGAEVFLPWWPREVKVHGMAGRVRETRRRPLFPGYLFARLGEGMTPGALGVAPSVDGLLGAGERLLTMAGEAVAEIAAMCDTRQCVDIAALPEPVRARLADEGCVAARRSMPEERLPPLRVDEKVTVTAGLFAGFTALVEQFSTGAGERWFDKAALVCVSVSAHDRFVRVRLARADLATPMYP